MNMPRTALICGGSKSVFNDIAAVYELFQPDAVIAINNILADLENVDFFVTNHPSKITEWLYPRRAKGYEEPKSFWTLKDKLRNLKGLQSRLPVQFQTLPTVRGGSGMTAIYLARYLNCQKIVLAGCPMTPEGAHYHDKKPWREFITYRLTWERNDSLKHDVRSMSGWTREFFGYPDSEWLEF